MLLSSLVEENPNTFTANYIPNPNHLQINDRVDPILHIAFQPNAMIYEPAEFSIKHDSSRFN